MTAPISNGPTTTRLHHYAGHYWPRPPARIGDLTSFGAAPRSLPVPSGPSGALHSCVAAKEPRFRLLIGVIALLREVLHCLVASASLAYLVHRFL